MKAHALLIVFIASFLFGGSCFAQEQIDVVYLKNGSKIRGTIIEQVPNKQLTIAMRDGSEFVYTFDEIEIIRKERSKEHRFDLMHAEYLELGINFGTPAGLNLAAGYWFDEVGLRFTGMILEDLAGIQANVGFKLSENSRRSHVLAVIAGVSEIVHKEWTYYGGVYELNLSGFFLQAGATFGRGGFSSPQLALQIGYMHSFLPD
jgi:hypothetical protein